MYTGSIQKDPYGLNTKILKKEKSPTSTQSYDLDKRTNLLETK